MIVIIVNKIKASAPIYVSKAVEKAVENFT
jgi:hypothetical protein